MVIGDKRDVIVGAVGVSPRPSGPHGGSPSCDVSIEAQPGRGWLEVSGDDRLEAKNCETNSPYDPRVAQGAGAPKEG